MHKYVVEITIKISPCFGVNTPSSGSLQVLSAKMIKQNIVMCRYDKILVNLPAWVIPS